MSQPVGNVGTAADSAGSFAELCSFAGTGTGTGAVAGASVGKATQQSTGSSSNVISQEKRISGAGMRSGQEREDPAIRKFKDCVHDAERSSLILNLNLGRIPVVNKDTMSKRATLALTSLAAKKENKKGTIPSSEAVGAIDDVLSVVKNISFFGTGTKTYSNEKDELSGAYCTAPVKYEFKDRETKFSNLRAVLTVRHRILPLLGNVSGKLCRRQKKLIRTTLYGSPWTPIKWCLKLRAGLLKMRRITDGSTARLTFRFRRRP
jgi:hypothetical protein